MDVEPDDERLRRLRRLAQRDAVPGLRDGHYSFFNQGVPIFATQAFQSPTTPGVQFHDIFTIFLDATHGSGGISSVINGVGGIVDGCQSRRTGRGLQLSLTL